MGQHYKLELSLKWIMKYKRLWYLLDEITVQLEDGRTVSRDVQERDANAFCADVIESINEDNI